MFPVIIYNYNVLKWDGDAFVGNSSIRSQKHATNVAVSIKYYDNTVWNTVFGHCENNLFYDSVIKWFECGWTF